MNLKWKREFKILVLFLFTLILNLLRWNESHAANSPQEISDELFISIKKLVDKSKVSVTLMNSNVCKKNKISGPKEYSSYNPFVLDEICLLGEQTLATNNINWYKKFLLLIYTNPMTREKKSVWYSITNNCQSSNLETLRGQAYSCPLETLDLSKGNYNVLIGYVTLVFPSPSLTADPSSESTFSSIFGITPEGERFITTQ